MMFFSLFSLISFFFGLLLCLLLGFLFFFFISFLLLLIIRPLDHASLVLRNKDRIAESWGLSGVDELGHLIEIGLLDPVDDWVDVEGSLVVQVALRIIIVVQCPARSLQFDGELLLNRDSGVQSPVIETIREVSGMDIEEDGIDDVTILLLIVVVDMDLQIMEFAMDDVFGDMVKVEAIGLEYLGYSISGDVNLGEVEGSCEVYVRNVIGDLRVVGILRGELNREAGIAGCQLTDLLCDIVVRPGTPAHHCSRQEDQQKTFQHILIKDTKPTRKISIKSSKPLASYLDSMMESIFSNLLWLLRKQLLSYLHLLHGVLWNPII